MAVRLVEGLRVAREAEALVPTWNGRTEVVMESLCAAGEERNRTFVDDAHDPPRTLFWKMRRADGTEDHAEDMMTTASRLTKGISQNHLPSTYLDGPFLHFTL